MRRRLRQHLTPRHNAGEDQAIPDGPTVIATTGAIDRKYTRRKPANIVQNNALKNASPAARATETHPADVSDGSQQALEFA